MHLIVLSLLKVSRKAKYARLVLFFFPYFIFNLTHACFVFSDCSQVQECRALQVRSVKGSAYRSDQLMRQNFKLRTLQVAIWRQRSACNTLATAHLARILTEIMVRGFDWSSSSRTRTTTWILRAGLWRALAHRKLSLRVTAVLLAAFVENACESATIRTRKRLEKSLNILLVCCRVKKAKTNSISARFFFFRYAVQRRVYFVHKVLFFVLKHFILRHWFFFRRCLSNFITPLLCNSRWAYAWDFIRIVVCHLSS